MPLCVIPVCGKWESSGFKAVEGLALRIED